MILKKITLHNYRQHRDLDVDFTGNLIAVVGKNGSGKSNFLGAIQFALTGEQPGFNKEDLLTWGEESGYVELAFEHNGKDCLIQRRVEKPAATLAVGSEKITGTKKVQEALEGMGIDKDVLRQSVFVRQTEIESCLFTDPRERELAFQKLIGLGDAAKHNKFLTDFLSALERPKDLTEEIERHVRSREQQLETQKALKAQSEELGRRLAGKPDDAEARKKVSVLQERIGLVRDTISAMEALELRRTAESRFKGANEKALSRDVVDETELDSKIAGIRSDIFNTRLAEDANRRMESVRQRIERVEARIAEIGDVAARVAEFDAKNQRRIEASARRREIERLLSNAPDGNVCPLCGSTTKHNIRAELESELASVKAVEAEMDAFVKASTAYKDRIELAAAKEQLTADERTLAGENVREVKVPSSELQRMLDDAERDRSAVHDANEETKRAKLELSHLSRSVADGVRDLEACLSRLPNRNVTADQLKTVVAKMNSEIDAIFAGMKELSDLKAQKASLDGGIAQVDAAVADTEKAIESLKELQRSNAVKEDRIRIVQDVKDWFSYKNGPRVMTNAIMSILTDETNRFLGQFGSPFNVVPMEEGMGFRCIFNDGRTIPNPPPEASMLSGGQKIALAVSFRFAVYSMFAGKLGLLSLDEPTAYLDDETINRFADMLGKIREIAKNANLEVFISTHEAQLQGAFDQTIVIGR